MTYAQEVSAIMSRAFGRQAAIISEREILVDGWPIDVARMRLGGMAPENAARMVEGLVRESELASPAGQERECARVRGEVREARCDLDALSNLTVSLPGGAGDVRRAWELAAERYRRAAVAFVAHFGGKDGAT